MTTSDGENGNRFIGDKGWLFVSRERIEASDPAILKEPFAPEGAIRLYNSSNHMANFLDGVRTRKRPICDVEVGHTLGERLPPRSHRASDLEFPSSWDPKPPSEFVGPYADKGNAMIAREYRSPWKLEV